MYDDFDEFEECSCHPKFEECAFETAQMKPAFQRHLKRDQIRRIERLHAELIEIEPLPLQDWIHGIAIQPDPEQEIRTTEATLHVFQKIDAEASLTLEQRRRLYGQVAAIMLDHRCVDPQRDISGNLPDWQMISGMCREARESYATWCHT